MYEQDLFLDGLFWRLLNCSWGWLVTWTKTVFGANLWHHVRILNKGWNVLKAGV